MKRTRCLIPLLFTASLSLFAFGGREKNTGSDAQVKIGIAKITQHIALDKIEQGVMDRLKEAGIDASYDLQNANGDVNTTAQIANKYKRERPDVIVAIATPVAVAMANAINDIPIVFGTVNDPVAAGLVSSTDRGEGNITGSSDALPIPENIELFRTIVGSDRLKTLGYIYTASEANSVSSLTRIQEACKYLGIELVAQSITNSSEIKQAAEAIVRRVDGIYLTTDNTVFSALPALVQVFREAKKPIFSADVTGALEGGCMIASGFDYYKAGLATGDLIVQILQGEKPENIPVRFMTDPSDSELLIDLDAAANCGITIPQNYVDQANIIIENGVRTDRQ